MAIYGIGTDVIQVSRVAAVMTRTQGRFAEKVLGPDELRIYHARNERSPCAASHFSRRVSLRRKRFRKRSASACTGR